MNKPPATRRPLSASHREKLEQFLSGASTLPLLQADPENRYERFPLSDMQEAYWVGRVEGLELSNIACQIYYEFEATAEFDLDRFRQAWAILIQRHDMLRVVVDSDGWQRILPHVPELEIQVEHLTAGQESHQLDSIRRELTQAPPASSEQWPLFAVRVSFLPSSPTRIHFRFDVLIGDGQSALTLLRELSKLTLDTSAALPPIELYYRDYQLWNRRTTDAKAVAKAEAYWNRRFPTLPSGPDLPLSCDPALISRPKFVRRQALLKAGLWRQLKESCAGYDLTPTTLLLAAFAEVLAHWSRHPRFSVNITLFDRRPAHPHVDLLVGDFTSTLPLEINGEGPEGFVEFARQLQCQLWEDMEHAQFSGIPLSREWNRRRGEAPRALVPVVFTSHLNESKEPLPWPIVYGVSQTPQVWVDHQVVEEAGGLRFHWDYVEGLFPEGVLEAMFKAYEIALRKLATGEQFWRMHRRGLMPVIRTQEATAPVPGPAVLPIWGEIDGGAIAVRCSDRHLKYEELRRRSRTIARKLQRQGVEAEQLVAVVMEKGWEQVVAVTGILESGAAYVPMDPHWPQARLLELLQETQAQVVLTTGEWQGKLRWPQGIEVWAVEQAGDEEAEGGRRPGQPEQLAYVIYTSGSTGKPKGVMIENGAATNTLRAINQRYRVNAQDRLLALSSLSFDLSVYDIFGMLAAGGSVVMTSVDGQKDPTHWLERMEVEGVTLWNSVPALMEMLVEHLEQCGLQGPRSLRLVLLSGDWIPVTLPDRIRNVFPGVEIVSLGGATEGAIWSIAYEIGTIDNAWKSIPYGRPLEGQNVQVRDWLGHPRLDWVTGELYIEGLGVARGYWADPERTAKKFPRLNGAPVFRTGDLGRRRPDGTLELLGREDFQIKLHGFRIEPGEIEAALLDYPEVKAAAVVIANQQLAAFIVPAQPASQDSSALRSWLQSRLPSHMIPSVFSNLKALPLSPNGKVDRTALTVPTVTEAIEETPDGSVESQLAGLWCDCLGRHLVSRHDDFFSLGGDSVRAVRLHGLVQKSFGIAFPLRRIFESPRLNDMARAIEQSAVNPAPVPEIVPDADGVNNPFPITDIQQAYWIGRQDGFELSNVATHSYSEFDTTSIDIVHLERCVQKLIVRHGMLRAIILSDGRQQVLDDPGVFRIQLHDLREHPLPTVEQKLGMIRTELSHVCRDPQIWPLFDIHVSRLSGCDRIHISIDLLIADAWSLVILSRELARYYADPQWNPAPLHLTFRDYVLADAETRTDSQIAADLAYWRAILPSLPPAPQLPIRSTKNPSRRMRFARRSGWLPPVLWRSLRETGSRFGLTHSAAVCAVFADVLANWSTQPRFTLNTTLFNRQPLHPEVNQIVGDFTSMTFLEVDVSVDGPFVSHASRLQHTLRQHLAHSMVSGIRLLRELGKTRPTLMPVVFTSTLGVSDSDDQTYRLPFRYVYGVSQTPQVWLDHQVGEEDGGLRYHWDFVEDLFAEGVAEAMFSAYEAMLRKLSADERNWKLERSQLLPASPEPEAVPLDDGPVVLPLWGQTQSDSWAVLCPDRSLSYGELQRQSRALARRLQKQGVHAEQLVAVVMEKGWEQVVAVTAVLEAGAAYVPLDPRWPEARLLELLRESEARVALTTLAWQQKLLWPMETEAWSVEQGGEDDSPSEAAPRQPGQLAYVIYTSGSTGKPKGVMIEHSAAANTVRAINQRFQVNAQDRVLALSELSFDLSVYDIVGMLAAGGGVVMPSKEGQKDPSHWLERMEAERVTIWNTVPALMEMLVTHLEQQGLTGPNYLRLVMLSGDWIPVTLPDRIRQVFPGVKVVSLGGATEGSIWSIAYEINEIDKDWKSIPYGRSLQGQNIQVRDWLGRSRPNWVTGELYIEGSGVARGYWADPDRTAEKFPRLNGAPVYRTGDLGCRWPDSTIELLGRLDSQIKLRGFRIEPAEIEAAILDHPGVKSVAVVLAEQQLTAFIVPAHSSSPDPAALDKLTFRLSQPGLRGDLQGPSTVLPCLDGAELQNEWLKRHSAQGFVSESVPLEKVGQFLSCLRSLDLPEHPFPKFRYASAGGLYPVQVYLLVGENRISGLSGGCYYYDPAQHRLCELDSPPDSIHIRQNPAFLIFLVARLSAIEPIYGSHSLDLAKIEAGEIAHALELEAAKTGIGLCQIGMMPFDRVRSSFRLEDSDVYLHGLWGGIEDPTPALPAATTPSKAELIDFLGQRLPAHMIPAQLRCVNELPLTSNQKIDRMALGRMALNTPDAAPDAPPQSNLEEKIAAVWCEILQRPFVGRDESFYSAGGDSILLVRLRHRLEEVLGTTVSLGHLLRYSTIQEFASALTDDSSQAIFNRAEFRAARRLKSRE